MSNKPELFDRTRLHCSECGNNPRGDGGVNYGNSCPCGGYHHLHDTSIECNACKSKSDLTAESVATHIQNECSRIGAWDRITKARIAIDFITKSDEDVPRVPPPPKQAPRHLHCEMCNSAGMEFCGGCAACKAGDKLPRRGESESTFEDVLKLNERAMEIHGSHDHDCSKTDACWNRAVNESSLSDRSDIVAHLRFWADLSDPQRPNEYGRDELLEAADEIERLQEFKADRDALVLQCTEQKREIERLRAIEQRALRANAVDIYEYPVTRDTAQFILYGIPPSAGVMPNG